MQAETRTLPHPVRERWQPLRSGLVNLYRYDREEFHYENGRLLLRGNNGTGKSRVLALQLPFLLDCDVNPLRLEPDADPSKRIEWNLLMDRYPERTGYTWIEFGRCDEGGAEHYLTLGCGLSAVQGRSGVRQWFFITSQRIGKQLELATRSSQVLGKDRLREKIGSAGEVFDSPGAYRRAVNETLFKLDDYRYASLINLLIQLRRPQLTRRLEEHELSRALSEALPPVSPVVIGTLADAFSNLESDRSQLVSSKTALTAVEEFLAQYRHYAQVAAKRRAERVLAAHYEYETAVKEILTAESECDRSLAELARLKTEIQRLSVEEHALQAEIKAFQQNSHVKDPQALEQAHREATERRRDADFTAAHLADASRVRKACTEEHKKVQTTLEHRQVRLTTAADAASEAALLAGLESIHHDACGALDSHTVDEAVLKQARNTIDAGIQNQIEKMEHARKFKERVMAARESMLRATAERDQLAGLFDDARERLNGAIKAHRSAITSFLEAVSAWTADLTELPLPFDQDFLNSVTDFCDQPHRPNPFSTASRKAFEELTASFAEKRAYLKQLEKSLTEELTRLETELENLTSGDSQPDRVLELQAAIAEAQGRLDPVLDSIDELNHRESVLRNEAHSVPADDALRAAYNHSVALAQHVDSLKNRIEEAEEYVRQKQFRFEEARQQRDREVTDLGIDKWLDDLDSLKDLTTRYRFAVLSLWQAVESLQDAQAASAGAWTHLGQATAWETGQKELLEQLDRRATAAEIACNTAGKAVDADYKEVLQRITQARERLDQLHAEEKELRRRYHDTEVAVNRVDERLRNRTQMLTGETDRRDTAAASLMTFASAGLLQLASPETDSRISGKSSTTRAVEMAFELKSRLAQVDADDQAWEHLQKSTPAHFSALMKTLSAQGCQSSATFRDDVFVATGVFAGQEHPIDELKQILAEDVASRQMLLDAREKEILENHLVGTVSSHLRELLQAAEQQVREMNDELESRPMSTGMKLRFVWKPAEDGPAGMVAARQRLMQSREEWSLAERQMLGSFLQQQIQTVCSEIDGASWQESLSEALDYRKWHWFGVERYQDGVWKRLTRRTHGTGSGGEKAVALTLPHFAAAAAFYRTAHPLAPRLILLDEAFVGIDSDMRAKCMGLIHTFDLDFMMTSEREWGCYQTLPALAIYQLSTRPGIDAVGLTRWVWNGRQRSLGNAEQRNDSSDMVAVAQTTM
jgi:putative exonuclease SbcCD C subunit